MQLHDDELLRQLASALDLHNRGSTLVAFSWGCVLTLTCLAVVYFYHRHSEQHKQKLEAAAHMADASTDHLRALLRDALPAW